MEASSFFTSLIISLIFIIVLWLLLRELVCWYYKINQQIDNQNKTNELLEKILKSLNQNTQTELYINEETEVNVEFDVSSVDIENCTFNYANVIASKYNEKDNNDWRIPTKDELIYVFQNKEKYPFLKNEKYWSSTENDKGGIFVLDFLRGVDDLFRGSNNFRAFFVRGKLK